MNKALFYGLFANLIVKFAFYLVVSIIFIGLMSWAEIINAFSWRYSLVLALGMLAYSLMFAKPSVQEKRK